MRRPDAPEAGSSDRDAALAELLDSYVEALHRGDAPSRSLLFERHPELAGLLACLETLDSLGPQPTISAKTGQSGFDGDRTVVLDDGGDPGLASGPAPATPGERLFGKYELLDELGRGGMGVVYRARQTDLDRTVALKMILASRLASAEDVRRFYQEAQAAGRLRHPNILSIHEVGQHDGQHYFTMDYIEGESLAERLRRGPFDPETAAGLLGAVARAVEYLHAHQIVHRDLKPSNILLDETGCPYVMDFGLAKVFGPDSQETQTGTIIGTPSYMAPEQAAGHPSQVSGRSDVYSLGAILYEMLTGRPPFKRENPLDTLVDVLEGEPTLLTKLNRQVPRELELICLRCLEKDPEKRYASAAALADDLERSLRGEPVEAQPSGLWQRLRRWGRREPALVSRLGGLLVAATVIQVNFLIRGVDLMFHLKVMGLLGAWGVLSFVFQRMLHTDRWAGAARFAWSAADILMLTALLLLAQLDGSIGPLLIGYPLLIVSAGLFFQVRLVWFTTLLALIAFAVLIVQQPEPGPPHYSIIYAAVLAVLGFIVAYQVDRVRTLGRYFEQRRGI
jgi:serine/threonine-protein kinase